MLIFFIIFSIAIQNQILTANFNQNEVLVSQLFNIINNEVVIANSVNSGYLRTFTLPGELDGSNYSVTLNPPGGQDLLINFRGRSYLFFLDFNATGFSKFHPGPNVISN